MPVELHYGMDHQHYDWIPLNSNRGVLRWPKHARIALCVVVTLDHMEWRTPEGAFQSASLAGGYGPSPFPDVTRWSHREYGHRVGVFRVLDTLARYGICPTVAMDVLTAENYPFLVRLNEVPVDGVKLDLSFLRERPARPEDVSALGTIGAVARALKLRVSAQGVEGTAQLDLLKKVGCVEAQGFHLGPPVSAAELGERLATQAASPTGGKGP